MSEPDLKLLIYFWRDMAEDAIKHEDSEDCVCGPTIEPVKRDDGSVVYIAIHHRLDWKT